MVKPTPPSSTATGGSFVGGDVQGHGGRGRRGAVEVGDRVGEGVGTDEVEVGGVGEGAVAVRRGGAVGWSGDHDDRRRIDDVVDVDVVAGDVVGGDGRVLGGGEADAAVVDGHWRVVDPGDRDLHRGHTGSRAALVDCGVGEGVDAGEIGGWNIGDHTTGLAQRASHSRGRRGVPGERAAVGIAVIVADGEHDRCVFGCDRGVVGGGRRLVDIGDGHREGRCGRRRSIRDEHGEFEARRRLVVECGGQGDDPVAVDGERIAGVARGDGVSQDIAVDVGGGDVRDGGSDCGVLGDNDVVDGGLWRVVGRQDGKGYDGDHWIVESVRDRVCELIGAVVVRIRGVPDLAGLHLGRSVEGTSDARDRDRVAIGI